MKKIRWQWLHDFGFIFPAAISLGLQMQPIMAAPWLEGKGPQSRNAPPPPYWGASTGTSSSRAPTIYPDPHNLSTPLPEREGFPGSVPTPSSQPMPFLLA